MTDRDAYVQKMKEKLDEWNAEIDRLSARAEAAKADTKMEYEKQLAAMRKQREEALQAMRDLQSASDSAWDDLRAGMEASWERMSNAFREAASRFK